MSAITIGNTIQNALPRAAQAPVNPNPAAQSYQHAQAAGAAAQIASASRNYTAPQTQPMLAARVLKQMRQYLKHAATQHISEEAYSEVIAAYSQAMYDIYGDLEGEQGLQAKAHGLLQCFKQLEAESVPANARQQAASELTQFTGQISTIAQKLQALQQQADAELKDMVADTNRTIRHIDALNAALSNAYIYEQPSDDLEADMSEMVAVLAGYLGIETMSDETGAMRVFLGREASLVGNGSPHLLRYEATIPAYASRTEMLGAITLLADDALESGNMAHVVALSADADAPSLVSSGAIAGLQHARDTLIPGALEALDYTITNLRDGMNAAHQNRMRPAPRKRITGNIQIDATQQHAWQGAMGIEITRLKSKEGSATRSETIQMQLDMSQLDEGSGAGNVSVDAWMNEMNHYFSTPETMTAIGNITDIQLVSAVQQLPTVPSAAFSFDLELRTAEKEAPLFLHEVRVIDDAKKHVSSHVPATQIGLSTAPYHTEAGSNELRITCSAVPKNINPSQMVWLPKLPKGTYHGIESSMLSGCFAITRIEGNDIYVHMPAAANKAGAIAAPLEGKALLCNSMMLPANRRGLRSSPVLGDITCDLRSAPEAAFYDVALDIGTVDAQGNTVRGEVRFRIANHTKNIWQQRFQSYQQSGAAKAVRPEREGPELRAFLVDASGTEVARDETHIGYVCIETTRPEDMVSMHAQSAKHTFGASICEYLGIYPLFARAKPCIKNQHHIGAATQLALSDDIRANPLSIAMACPKGVLTDLPIAALAEMHTNICDQANRAHDTHYLASQTLEGYTDRMDAIGTIDPEEEMHAMDIYHQSHASSSRAIAQMQRLHRSLCTPSTEAL